MAREAGMAVMPWSPLAGGLLTGKYRRDDTPDTSRPSGANPFGGSRFTDRNQAFLFRLCQVADEVDSPRR